MIGTCAQPQFVEQSIRESQDVAPATAVDFRTSLGWMAVACEGQVVHGLAFGHRTPRDARLALGKNCGSVGHAHFFLNEEEIGRKDAWVAKLIVRLRQFADGQPTVFADLRLADDHLTPFARRVVAACRRIPWGRTRSYGDLAAECGSPGAARAVGTVMARNRYPLIVPCHRVLAASGRIGGYSAPDGLLMKRRLLDMEQSAF